MASRILKLSLFLALALACFGQDYLRVAARGKLESRPNKCRPMLDVFMCVDCGAGQMFQICRATGTYDVPGASYFTLDGNSVKLVDRAFGVDTSIFPSTAIADAVSATTYDLTAVHNGQQIPFTAGTDVTLNLSSTVAVKGFTILIIQRGAGSVIPTAGSGVTIRQRQSYTKTAGQYAVATLSCDIARDCILAGDLQ